MSTRYLLYILPCVVLLTGCQQYGILVKRKSEQNCPTDIRKTVPWCAGEDAIFRCPCGPNEQFHGHRPTCWMPWQTTGTEWRDMYCNSSFPQGGVVEPVPLPEVAPTQSVEIIAPRTVAPVMPKRQLEQQPTSEDRGILIPSEPEGLELQPEESSGASSSRKSWHLPWGKKREPTRTKSLTDYFHELKQQDTYSAARSPKDKPRTQTDFKPSGTSNLTTPPERLVLLPRVESEEESVSQSNNRLEIVHATMFPAGTPSSQISSNHLHTRQRDAEWGSHSAAQAASSTLHKIEQVKTVAAQQANSSSIQIMKPVEHSSFSKSRAILLTNEPTQPAFQKVSPIAILEKTVPESSPKSPIQVVTKPTRVQPSNTRISRSPAMSFVR